MEKYQTIGSRFLALIIDFLIMLPLTFLAALFANVGGSLKAMFVLNVIISSVPLIYTILMHNFYGQTLGKMAMKVKVLDVSERPITFIQAVIRNLPQMLPLFITASTLISGMNPSNDTSGSEFLKIATTSAYFLYGIWGIFDIIVCLSSDTKRALHDFIAGTVVVKTNATNTSIKPDTNLNLD